MFKLPQLNYPLDALEPYIDKETMNVHYSKHHQGYVDKLNAAIDKYPELHDKSIEELLSKLDTIPQDLGTAVKNFGGGHYNHSLFWSILAPADSKEARFEDDKFMDMYLEGYHGGSYSSFQEEFKHWAMGVFGSGWVWLVVDKEKRIDIVATQNQDSPISQGLHPILTLDLWEHAYYLKYKNEREKYVYAFFDVINWKQVYKNYEHALQKLSK